MWVCTNKNEESEKTLNNRPSTKYDHFMRVCMNKNEENKKASTKGSSTKYDQFMRVCTNKNEENEKFLPLKISIITLIHVL